MRSPAIFDEGRHMLHKGEMLRRQLTGTQRQRTLVKVLLPRPSLPPIDLYPARRSPLLASNVFSRISGERET